jgi:acyl-CoA synthetase (AMP-forming)/AMP-acid ligase II
MSKSLPARVLASAARDPGAPALIDAPSGTVVPYGLLAERIGQVAGGLRSRGFGTGDVLALWAPNVPRWAGVAFGAMAAGGAVTGIHPLATEREARAQIEDAGASVVVTAPGPDLLGAPGEIAAGPLALLPYSSGTTGLPKAVMLTHDNLLAASDQLIAALGLHAGDTVLAVAPFCHVMGFIVSLTTPLAAGATVVTLPRFELEAALAAIERHRVTMVAVPPPVMTALAHHPAVDRYDLSSLELVISGGAPLGAPLQRAVAARLPHAVVAQGYGLTETSVALSGPQGRRPTAPGSVGRPMRDTEVKLVDGELWVRGPQVTAGYLNAPADLVDGWLRTGDLVEIDEQGDLYVRDRIKELIKVNGHQVAPAELEALLQSHPRVADAAVVRRADPRTGEAPVAVVVPRGDVDPLVLSAWVDERVAPYKRLRAVHVAATIPRTASGKILRRELAARYA